MSLGQSAAFLGVQTLWHAFRPAGRGVERPAGRELSRAAAYRRGLASNLGNPKMAVFFTSLLPQFGSSFGALLGLGLVFCVLTLTWLSGYAVVVARAGALLRRPGVRRALDALTGTVLVAFGVRLAAVRR